MSDADRVKELFLVAIDVPERDRSAWLALECGSNHALRSEVEALLAEERLTPDGFMATPAIVDSLTDEGRGAAGDSRSAHDGSTTVPMPERIGRFRVIRLIGEGGMGTVYEAEQEAPRRPAAVKILRADASSRDLWKRFRREAEVLGQLHHAGIARVYEAGVADIGHGPQPYIAMELIRGLHLSAFVRENRPDRRQRLEIFARICDAVQHAHDAGVVHRDLKPANILVETDAQPKVLDFGIARLVHRDPPGGLATRTATGQIMGTLPYMSPEQVSGDLARLDGRSDIYTLGVILYEILAERHPFDLAAKPLLEAARVICEEDPTSLGAIDPALRGDVETIAAKAMEKEPARRYASPADLANDVRRFLADRPIIARPPTTFYRIKSFAKRNKGLMVWVGLTFVSLVAGIVVATIFAFRASRNAETALQRELAAENIAYRAGIQAAAAAIEDGNAFRARANLEQAPARLRGWEWRHLASRLDESLLCFAVDAEGIAGAFFSSDGRSVTVALPSRRIRFDADTGGVLPEPEIPPGVHHASSRGGSSVAWVGPAGDIHVRRLSEGSVRTLSRSELGLGVGVAASNLALDDAAKTLAFKASEGPNASRVEIRIVDLEHRSTRVVPKLDGVGSYPAVVGGNGFVCVIDPIRPAPFVCDVDTMEVVSLAGDMDTATDVDLDPEGSRAVTTSKDGSIRLFAPGSGEAMRSARGHDGGSFGVRFSPSGKLIASVGHDRRVRVWNAETLEPLAAFMGHEGDIQSLAFSPDGTRLVTWSTADKSVRVWDVASLDDPCVLLGHASFVYGVAVSPDGARIATCGWDGFAESKGSFRLWDAASGESIAAWGEPGQMEDGIAVAYSADGRLLAGNTRIGAWFRDALTGADRTPQVDPGATVLRCGFGALGAWFLSRDGSAERVTAGETATWTQPAEAPLAESARAESSSDGRFAAFVEEGSVIRLLDARDGSLLAELSGHEAPVSDTAFSPDGRLLASASADGTVRVWQTSSGKAISTLTGDSSGFLCVAFSPDGSRLLAGGRDTVVRVFDTSSLEPIAELRGHTSYIKEMVFSPDGERLFTASGDHTVRVWETTPRRERLRSRREYREKRFAIAPEVDRLFDDLRDAAAVIERLRSDGAGIDARTREIALQIAIAQSLRRESEGR